MIGGCPGFQPPYIPPEPIGKVAVVGDTVVLDVADSSESSDVAFAWTQTGGPASQLTDTSGRQLTFIPRQDGDYEFTATITDDTGTSRTVIVRVWVLPAPTVNPTPPAPEIPGPPEAATELRALAGPDQSLIRGESVTLIGSATGGTKPYQYVWTPSDSLDDSTKGQPVSSPSTTTEYTLTVTDAAGARATDSVVVTVVTPVSGVYWSDAVWTAAESPYRLTGDVQIPAGVTLTIEPGVEVQYLDDTQLYVRGTVVANGAPPKPILFTGAYPAGVANATFIRFEGANLSDSQLSHFVMKNAVKGLSVGQEPSFAQAPRNTGSLVVAHARFEGTTFSTVGYDTGARATLTDCTFVDGTIGPWGDDCRSEPVDFIGCTITNCTLYAASAKGVTLTGCALTDTLIVITCQADLRIADSVLDQCAIQGRDEADDFLSSVAVQRCLCTNVGLSCFVSDVSVSDSTFQYDSAFAPVYLPWGRGSSPTEAKLSVRTAAILYTTIAGDGTGAAIHARYNGYDGAFVVSHSTIRRFEVGVIVNAGPGLCRISDSNLVSNTQYAVDHRQARDLEAVNNYWGTAEAASIPLAIRDYFDDITRGRVNFAPFSPTPLADAGPRP
jgi:uncharacterized protein YjbI with pentapeptide repeats